MDSFFATNDITRIVTGRSRRESSWDQTGGNDDCIRIEPGETRVLADISGPGKITHIYFTMIDPDIFDYRDAVLRMYWDGEETPSVEVPLGDFFGIGHCMARRYSSLMMAVNPGCGPEDQARNNGFNCYFPMPFATGARIELENQSARVLGGILGRLWYHIDYEVYDNPPPEDVGRFHAQWRRENPTTVGEIKMNPDRGSYPGINIGGEDNYVMLEAQGQGHIAGLFLQVDNLQGGWYGEGDDMLFIDGDTWPPSQHGTGSEEVFGGGACPDREYAGIHSGFVLIENEGGESFKGKNAMYRWYTQDPIRFNKSVRMSIEHGHANDFENDYASVVYWYQKEPHAAFPVLPAVGDRRPHMAEAFLKAHEKLERAYALMLEHQEAFVFRKVEPPAWLEFYKKLVGEAIGALYTKEYNLANLKMDQAVLIAERQGAAG